MSSWRGVILGIVGVAIVVLLYGLLFPSFYGYPKEWSYKTACLSNLKQLGVTTLIYVDDHDGRFPANAWFEPLMPYAKNEDIFTCSEIRVRKQKWGYAMNLELMGARSTAIPAPGTKPMLFETDALAKDVVANLQARVLDRHKRTQPAGSAICRADSSVKFVPADTAIHE